MGEHDTIYVGYRPVPPRLARFLRITVPALAWMLCGATALWAVSQRSPGSGVWETGQPVTLSGVLVARPYPMLLTEAAPGEWSATLLVEPGKHGAQGRLGPLDGRRLTVSGWPIHREGRRMLELEAGDGGVRPESSGSDDFELPTSQSRGSVTLRGEIVDSKCFLGAMKPGDGKTHKACATLCIRGGIPPLFVVRSAGAEPRFYLLQGPGGTPIDPALHPFIADPVEVSGELGSLGDMDVLTVVPSNVRRL